MHTEFLLGNLLRIGVGSLGDRTWVEQFTKHDNCALLGYYIVNSADYHYSLLFHGGSLQSHTVHNHICSKVTVLAFNFQAVLPQCQLITLFVMLTAPRCFKMCLYSQPSPLSNNVNSFFSFPVLLPQHKNMLL
jgi:hypothetical protein